MTPHISNFTKFFFVATLLLPATALAKQKETVLYNFPTQGGDGVQPIAGLIADASGNMYGTTFGGGQGQDGTVFEITPAGVETVLFAFGGSDGALPAAALTMDKKGNLYGTTVIGGANNQGVVFQLKPKSDGGWKETVLYNFCAQTNCADGATPEGPVTVGPDGALYGTTATGGVGAVTPNSGTVFRLTPGKHGAWTETVLHNFCDEGGCGDGNNPLAPRLLLTKSSTLYGTASKNTGNGGTLYSLNTDGGNFQVLHQFGDRPGYFPDAGVVSDKEGVLYGTLRNNSCAEGGVYSFDTVTSTYRIVQEFCNPFLPVVPSGDLTIKETKNGVTLYGTSQRGGQNDAGTFYQLTPPASAGDPWNLKVLYDFCTKASCADGGAPFSAAVLNENGVFYGTTSAGGAQNGGVVFRFGAN